MKTIELIRALRTTVLNDPATQAWSTANYGRNHKTYIGFDARKSPGEDACPVVVFLPAKKVGGFELTTQEYGVGVVCMLHDDSLVETGDDDSIEYTGIGNCEDFQKLVETAIVAALPAGFQLDEQIIEEHPVESFPFFLITVEMKITNEYYQGDDVFA